MKGPGTPVAAEKFANSSASGTKVLIRLGDKHELHTLSPFCPTHHIDILLPFLLDHFLLRILGRPSDFDALPASADSSPHGFFALIRGARSGPSRPSLVEPFGCFSHQDVAIFIRRRPAWTCRAQSPRRSDDVLQSLGEWGTRGRCKDMERGGDGRVGSGGRRGEGRGHRSVG